LNQSPIPSRTKVSRKKKDPEVVQTTSCNNTTKVGGEENTQSGSQSPVQTTNFCFRPLQRCGDEVRKEGIPVKSILVATQSSRANGVRLNHCTTLVKETFVESTSIPTLASGGNGRRSNCHTTQMEEEPIQSSAIPTPSSGPSSRLKNC
jgi:hypothetical protein